MIAIANAHTSDDANDSLSHFMAHVAVDANTILYYNVELDAPCRLRRLI